MLYSDRPEGFEWLASEPDFDPAIHLALEMPDVIESLTDFGYSAEQIVSCPSDFAVTSVFRVLSDEGAACLLDVCHQLEAFTTSNARIERNVRGGTYRSRFLRDLCLSRDVTAFMSEISGVALAPHSIPHQLGHLNYNPKAVGKNVDKWHVDTLIYDYVMFVTDPKSVTGGAFQYYRGTKDEVAALKEAGQSLPADKIISPDMPGPGYAVMQQGNMVVHQAKGLEAPGERITMVNGYVTQDASLRDYSRYDQLCLVDPAHIVTAEYARHEVHRADQLINQTGFQADKTAYIAALREAAARLEAAADVIQQSDKAVIEHFGDE